MSDEKDSCLIKSLPDDQLVAAAELAVEKNQANAPNLFPAGVMADEMNLSPQMIAALTSKYWKAQPTKITVSFMEKTSAELRARILGHLNAWNRTGILELVEAAAGKRGTVRITRAMPGFWSYLGLDCLSIPMSEPTMCLSEFSMQTSEAECRRVIRHEAGHLRGFPHEHMRASIVSRLDREKTYAYFARTSGWGRRTVDEQVFRSLNEKSLMGTPPNENSIMCYRFPGSITKDGKPILGGDDITESDFAFNDTLYPKQTDEYAMI